MRKRHSWRLLYWILLISSWTAWFISVAAAPSLKANPDQIKTWSEFGANTVAFTQKYAWLMIPVLVVLHTIGKDLSRRVGSPRKWHSIKRLLDHIQKHVFEKETGVAVPYNRVTLFKYKRWLFCWEKWPWTGWLVSVERSGHTTLRSKVRFRAPDDADLAEGVAGQTWVQNVILPVDGLADIENAGRETVELYAGKTWMPKHWLETANRKKRPRALCGIPVEVKGTVWGVIVLDSRSPTAIGVDENSQRVYKLMGHVLALLLEGN
jgi:hypothetical protein